MLQSLFSLRFLTLTLSAPHGTCPKVSVTGTSDRVVVMDRSEYGDCVIFSVAESAHLLDNDMHRGGYRVGWAKICLSFSWPQQKPNPWQHQTNLPASGGVKTISVKNVWLIWFLPYQSTVFFISVKHFSISVKGICHISQNFVGHISQNLRLISVKVLLTVMNNFSQIHFHIS